MEKITKKSVLKELQDQAWNNVFCYSSNYGMTTPKKGYEAEWQQAKAKARVVDAMVKEAEAQQPVPVAVDYTADALAARMADLKREIADCEARMWDAGKATQRALETAEPDELAVCVNLHAGIMDGYKAQADEKTKELCALERIKQAAANAKSFAEATE